MSDAKRERLTHSQRQRRSLLLGASLAWLTPLALGRGAEAPATPLARRVVRAPADTYFTYPHSNGFLPDGSAMLASPAGSGLEYLRWDPATGQSRRVNRIAGANMYYAIAANGRVATTYRNGLMVFDGTQPDATPRTVTRHPNWIHHIDCDISADGQRALVTRNRYVAGEGPPHRTDLVELASGESRTLMGADWVMDHAHFSPFDPAWICIACGEPERYQRLWVWHERLAPQGRALFRQVQADGKRFDVGHERALFTRRSMIVVAYGSNSDARPCGLYEVDFDGGVRLVSESNRDFHCNVSPDGRWAVVSLQGTHELQMQPIRAEWRRPEIGFGPSDVQVVDMRSGRRALLWRATNSSRGQPYEVQPTISPDGRWVLLKDAQERSVLAIEIDTRQLEALLS